MILIIMTTTTTLMMMMNRITVESNLLLKNVVTLY